MSPEEKYISKEFNFIAHTAKEQLLDPEIRQYLSPEDLVELAVNSISTKNSHLVAKALVHSNIQAAIQLYLELAYRVKRELNDVDLR